MSIFPELDVAETEQKDWHDVVKEANGRMILPTNIDLNNIDWNRVMSNHFKAVEKLCEDKVTKNAQ